MTPKIFFKNPNPDDLHLIARIDDAFSFRGTKIFLLEGGGGTGKTVVGKVFASRRAMHLAGQVFWISPELGALGMQLQGIESILGSKVGSVVIDCVDEWPNHAEVLEVLIRTTEKWQHSTRYLIMGRNIGFLRTLSDAQFFSLGDEPNKDWIRELFEWGLDHLKSVWTFDGTPLYSSRLVNRVTRFNTSGAYADGLMKSIPPFSFGAIIRVEGNHPDGQIVRIIDPLYKELVRAIERDSSLIYDLSPRTWEEIIAASYEKAGFDEVILTPRSGDLGRDVIAIKRGFGSVRFVEQIKSYKEQHIVKADEVRALLGVLQADQNASKAVFSTTSHFAPRIGGDKLIKPFLPHRLELVDREALLKRLFVAYQDLV
jgi:restriction system protein